jgi:hypothetical protein
VGAIIDGERGLHWGINCPFPPPFTTTTSLKAAAAAGDRPAAAAAEVATEDEEDPCEGGGDSLNVSAIIIEGREALMTLSTQLW